MAQDKSRATRASNAVLGALGILALSAGLLAAGASWQRTAQARETATGLSYLHVDGRDMFPDERTREDAAPTVKAATPDVTIAPCEWFTATPQRTIPADTLTDVCVTTGGAVVPVPTAPTR